MVTHQHGVRAPNIMVTHQYGVRPDVKDSCIMELLAQCSLTPRQESEKSNLTRHNGQKVLELRNVIDTLVLKMMVRGFHGEVMVKFIVHDGMIELIEECVRRKHR